MDDSARSNKRVKLDGSSSASPLYADCRSSDSDSDDGVALEILDDDLSCVICQ